MAHPSTATPVYNVPMALSGSSNRTLGLEPERAMARNLQHLAAARQCTLGPMPVPSFLDAFLPLPVSADRSGLLPSDGAFASVPLRARNVAGIIKPLLAALNGRSSSVSSHPLLTFNNTAIRSVHPRRLGYMKPEVCCFTSPNADIVLNSETGSRAEFGFLELFFKIEADTSYDMYSDPPPGADPEARVSHHLIPEYESDDEGNPSVVGQKAKKVFAQHIAFAAEVFARQHRVFLFTVSMFGSLARLLRWDRSGCILTESFDIREQPQLLCDFIWRFSQATYAGRGHDMTVEAALAADETLFHTLISNEVKFQLDVDGDELEQAMRHHYMPGRVTVVHVSSSETESDEPPRRFIVSRPVISSVSVAGRGTRGFWAVDTSNHSVVFLKDTWRSRTATGREGQVLRRLNAANVRNVPTLSFHGDVCDAQTNHSGPSRQELQTTDTDTFVSEPWNCQLYRGVDAQVTRRKHYRLVVSPVGYDLRYFRSTEELLHTTYDVFIAMKDALALDSRLHRDISVGNILLVKERDRDIRRGYLIDWECSCNVDESGQASLPGRVGTWEFMSTKMLGDLKNTRPHTIQDDMESLLYVVFYCALHWLPHNITDEDGLSELISNFFKRRVMKSGGIIGGDAKLSNAMNRVYTAVPTFASKGLREWLDTVLDYHSPPRGKEVEYADKWSNPDHLDAFWSEFLRTHELERGDRVTHEIAAEYVSGDSSSSEDSDDSSSVASSASESHSHDSSPRLTREPSPRPSARLILEPSPDPLPRLSGEPSPDPRLSDEPLPDPSSKSASLHAQRSTSLGKHARPADVVTHEPKRIHASPRSTPGPAVEVPARRWSARIRELEEKREREKEAVMQSNAPAPVPRARGRRGTASAPRVSTSSSSDSKRGGALSAAVTSTRGQSGGRVRGRGRRGGRGGGRGARTTLSRK